MVYTLWLYSPQGRLVKEYQINSTTKVNLSNLTTGVYLAIIRNGNGELMLTERIVKL